MRRAGCETATRGDRLERRAEAQAAMARSVEPRCASIGTEQKGEEPIPAVTGTGSYVRAGNNRGGNPTAGAAIRDAEAEPSLCWSQAAEAAGGTGAADAA